MVKFFKGLYTCFPIMLGFQLSGQSLNRRVCPLSKILGTWRKAYTIVSNNWKECRFTNVASLSMLSHAKSLASRYVYHYIIYKYLVCLYYLDDGILRKCIIQEPFHDKRFITKK